MQYSYMMWTFDMDNANVYPHFNENIMLISSRSVALYSHNPFPLLIKIPHHHLDGA